MPLTNEQIATLKGKVNKLVDDKADADAKTQASNTADTAAVTAAAAASQAKLDESAADATVASDLTDLVTFVESLAAPPDGIEFTPMFVAATVAASSLLSFLIGAVYGYGRGLRDRRLIESRTGSHSTSPRP